MEKGDTVFVISDHRLEKVEVVRTAAKTSIVRMKANPWGFMPEHEVRLPNSRIAMPDEVVQVLLNEKTGRAFFLRAGEHVPNDPHCYGLYRDLDQWKTAEEHWKTVDGRRCRL